MRRGTKMAGFTLVELLVIEESTSGLPMDESSL